jgi:eukaryotic-like serine/threonine-protein kinase
MALSSSNTRILLLVVAVGLVAFVIGFGVTALSFTRAGAPAEVVMVPDVREMRLDEARRLTSAAGLELTVGDSFPNPDTPAGAVLAQSPLPGREVSHGAEVRVILSTGQRRPTVPQVEAMPLSLATRALQAAGFDVQVEQAPGEGQVGRVVGVDPAPGTPLALPATVRVFIGAPTHELQMPSLIGMQEASAREAVEAAGLELSEVVYESSVFGEPGGVVAQDPPPGEIIEPGARVRLRVTEHAQDRPGTLGRAQPGALSRAAPTGR